MILAAQRIALLMLAAAVVAGCGVRGSLDPPESAQSSGTAKSAEQGAAGDKTAAQPKPHKPFILDGLLR